MHRELFAATNTPHKWLRSGEGVVEGGEEENTSLKTGSYCMGFLFATQSVLSWSQKAGL